MQKSVLNESINKLGIYQGDVIKIINSCGIDYYQYDGCKFIYLCATEEDAVMGEDEIFDLISGNLYFEIIARGENRPLNIEENVEDIKNRVNVMHYQMDNMTNKVNTYIQDQKAKEEKQKKVDLIVCGVCWGLIVLLIIFRSLLGG